MTWLMIRVLFSLVFSVVLFGNFPILTVPALLLGINELWTIVALWCVCLYVTCTNARLNA